MPQFSRFNINQKKTTAFTASEKMRSVFVNCVRADPPGKRKYLAIIDIELRTKETIEGLQFNYVLNRKDIAHAAFFG